MKKEERAMSSFTRLWIAFSITLLLLAGSVLPARGDLLSLVPKEDEFVAGINARQIADSELFQRLVKVRPRVSDLLRFLEQKLGVNVMKDVDKVYIYGKINNEDSMGIVFKGRIDSQKILTALAKNPENTSETVHGFSIHGWRDARAGRNKFCTFLPGGISIFWNSRAAMEASLNAAGDKTAALVDSPDGSFIPGEGSPATAWAAMINRENNLHTRQDLQVDRISAFLTMTQQDIQGRMTMFMGNPEDAQRWVQMMQGVVLFAQMQSNNRLLNDLARRTQVNLKEDGKSALLTTALDLANALDVLAGKKSLDDEEN
jgi:hypothetical protein